MNASQIEKIFADTAYVRTGGSPEERRCAEYIAEAAGAFGGEARLSAFTVPMATIQKATLTVTDKTGTREIPAKGYLCAGSGEVEAPLYYLPANTDKMLLSEVRGKIVLIDGYLGYWIYQDLFTNGAVGFITYDGNVHFADSDIDQRELRSYVSNGNKIPGVNINAKDAVTLIENDAVTAKITLEQEEYEGPSHNVILDIAGRDENRIIAVTAHYDSTSLSNGAYDNMSGSVCLLAMAEYFSKPENRPLCSLRFIWCGSEERGLLGSKAYCAENEEELKKIELCVNIDMIGCTMGKFIACCTSEDKLSHYIGYMGREAGFQVAPYQDVYSSDSTPFSDKGVPSVSFCRSSPREAAMIHNRYDTARVIKTEHMLADIGFIQAFTERMANAKFAPVEREIPDNVKDKLDRYLCRKR